MPQRHFLAALVRRGDGGLLIVRDANRQALAYVYFEQEPGRRAAAKLLTRAGEPGMLLNCYARQFSSRS
jgi:hypothetical protein